MDPLFCPEKGEEGGYYAQSVWIGLNCNAPKSMMNWEKPLVWSNRPELKQLGDGGNACYI